MLASGLRGEGHVGNDVWFIKTHYPLISPTVGAAKVNKAIICVRNPTDTLISYFEFKMTYSQNQSVDSSFYKNNPKDWDWFLKEHMDMWKKFYDYWIDVANSKTIPVYFFRFEDLMTNSEKVL